MSRLCHWCGASVPMEPEPEFCAACLEAFPLRPDPTSMTPDEREAEMRTLDGPLEVPFSLLHGRIEELVGRPVFTHEMALNWEGLCREARWEAPGSTLADVIELIPEEKRIVLIADDKKGCG